LGEQWRAPQSGGYPANEHQIDFVSSQNTKKLDRVEFSHGQPIR
jgi:hypothetical protein